MSQDRERPAHADQGITAEDWPQEILTAHPDGQERVNIPDNRLHTKARKTGMISFVRSAMELLIFDI